MRKARRRKKKTGGDSGLFIDINPKFIQTDRQWSHEFGNKT